MKTAFFIAVLLLIAAFASAALVRSSIAIVPSNTVKITAVQPTAIPLAVVSPTRAVKETNPVAVVKIPETVNQQIRTAATTKIIPNAQINPPNITIESLDCPSATMQEPSMPTNPFSKDKTDCQLLTNLAGVEQYLNKLQSMTEACKSRKNSNYDSASHANQFLHVEVDHLKVAPPPDTTTYQPARTTCSFSEPSKPADGGVEIPDPSKQYTNWLFGIGDDVKKYCSDIDNMLAEIGDNCRKVNKEIKCEMDQGGLPSEESKSAYHAELDTAMNKVINTYSYTETFYTYTLMTYDFGNFRIYFNNGTGIDCSMKPVSIVNIKDVEIPKNGTVKPNLVVSFFKNIFSWIFGK